MSQSSFVNLFTDDEIAVAETLFGLRDEIPFRWFHKRRRTNPWFLRLQEYLGQQQQQPALPPPSPLPTIVGPTMEAEHKKPAVKAEASSPATPLSFSPSESDEKPKRLKTTHVSFGKTKQKWEEILKANTTTKETLEEEIKILRCYYETLKAENLSLKKRAQELRETHKSLNPETNQDQSSSTIVSNQIHLPLQWFHQVPFIVDPTAITAVAEMSENYLYPYGKAMAMYPSGNAFCINTDEKVGPFGLPDLNRSPPLESSLSDNKSCSRAMAAEARLRRKQIRKEKSSNGSSSSCSGNSKLALSNR